MQIVNNGRLAENTWQHLDDVQPLPTASDITVTWRRWNEGGATLTAHGGRVGLRLNGDDDLDAAGPMAGRFPLIVVEFPTMTDGRGFSIARLLRDQYGFRGELRACGHFIRDQVFFLKRVGINSFEPASGDAAGLLPAFDDFTVSYQASQDQPLPLYRRR